MTIEGNLRAAEDHIKTYNDHDLDRLVTFWQDKQTGLERREFQKNLWLAAFPDTHMEVISMTAQDDRVVVEAIVRATHAGPLNMWVKHPIPATNKKIEFPYCSVGQYKNGKLVELRTYIDIFNILDQLGIAEQVNSGQQFWPD